MMMKTLAAAAFVSLAALGAASAESRDPDKTAPNARQPAPDARPATRLAEGWRFWEHKRHGEHHARHHRWRDDDDDDDDEGGHGRHARGGANRPADPNAANAPVPDNGVFNGKARPKVEVQ